MKEIIPFSYSGSPVRVIKDEHGEPWFVAADVARVLGYVNTRDAILRHCKASRRTVVKRDGTSGGNPNVVVIPERDVYRLIMHSKLPTALRFEDWVVGTVLPSIRKHGGYIKDQEKILDERELLAKALQVAGRIIEEKQKVVEQLNQNILENEPKVEAYDDFMDSDGLYTFRGAAKVLGRVNPPSISPSVRRFSGQSGGVAMLPMPRILPFRNSPLQGDLRK